jgi:hypothetical protein
LVGPVLLLEPLLCFAELTLLACALEEVESVLKSVACQLRGLPTLQRKRRYLRQLVDFLQKVLSELEGQPNMVSPVARQYVGLSPDPVSRPQFLVALEVGLVWQCSLFLLWGVVVVPLFDCGNVVGQIWGVVVL